MLTCNSESLSTKSKLRLGNMLLVDGWKKKCQGITENWSTYIIKECPKVVKNP